MTRRRRWNAFVVGLLGLGLVLAVARPAKAQGGGKRDKLTANASQQQSPPAGKGRWRRKARIVNGGQVCSTYNVGSNERSQLLAAGLSEADLERIVPLAHEREWPQRMRSLDGRIETRPQWSRYTVYHVAKFGSHDLVFVPAAENRDVPAAIRPSKDFYMIFGPGGVEVD